MLCQDCGDYLGYCFAYEYNGNCYCEDCMGARLFDRDHLIAFIDHDEDLQDEIYIERGFGVKLEQSSPLLREYCRKAVIEDWENGSQDWKNLKPLSRDVDFLEMFGAKLMDKEDVE